MTVYLIIGYTSGKPIILFESEQLAKDWLAAIDPDEQRVMSYRILPMTLYGESDRPAIFDR